MRLSACSSPKRGEGWGGKKGEASRETQLGVDTPRTAVGGGDRDPFMASSNVNGSGAVSPSTDVFLGDRVDDYVAHVIALSLIYRF